MTSFSAQRILLTGAQGQVGYELAALLAGHDALTAVDVAECDLTDPAAIEKLVREVNPTIIINPAAYTAVDKAEQEPELAHAINAVAPGILAAQAARRNALMLHYSTDYVFDGTASTPYTESHNTNPMSVYGRAKRDGELAVINSGARYIIARLAWVYGIRGNNFLLTMLRLAAKRPEIRVVNDQYGSPTWSRAIARATLALLETRQQNPTVENQIFHMTAGGATTWYGFAEAIFSQVPTPLKQLLPISGSEYPTPAARPAYSVLNNDKLNQTRGIQLLHWRDQLAEALAEYRVQHL